MKRIPLVVLALGLFALVLSQRGSAQPWDYLDVAPGLETLNLAGVEPGFYNLFCLPLKLVGTEGSPARVILTV